MTTPDPSSRVDTGRSGRRLLVTAAILLVAVNLRPSVTSVGPVLTEIRADLGIDAVVAGVLTALPVAVFAAASALVPWLRRHVSLGASVTAGMALVVVGTALRPFASATVLLLGTVVVMVGIAVVNVLLPVVVRSGFPGREGWITGAYVATLQLGAAAGALVTVPLAERLGGWPPALAAWAVVGVVGLLAWLPASQGVSAGGRRDVGSPATPRGRLVRDPTSRALVVFFSVQSLVGYVVMGWLPTLLREEGMSASSAGAMVAVVTIVSIPFSLVLPAWLSSRPDQRAAPLVIALPWAVAFVGLVVAPVSLAWVWATLLGIGFGGFAIVLSLFGLRTTTAADTMQVSTWAQSLGYLAALPGPLLVGVLAEATGGWTVPLLALLAAQVPMAWAGFRAGTDIPVGGTSR